MKFATSDHAEPRRASDRRVQLFEQATQLAQLRLAQSPLGKPTGVVLAARARRLEGGEAVAARAHMLRKYPLVHRLLVPLELWLKRTHEVRYELDRLRRLWRRIS